jgi:hypothetical protein
MVVLGIAALPALAHADPSATLTADVDGDGAADTLRLEPPGQLTIELAKGGGQLVPFAASGELTEARLAAGGPPSARVVVATARIGRRWEAVALGATRPGAALAELWRGPVGPTDDDEYEQWLDADAGGLVRYQARADQRRCDGAAIALFRERWDAKAKAFVPAGAATVAPPAGAAAVRAVPTGPGLPAGWYRAATASAAAGATDAGMLTAPRALGDGDPATAWRSPAGDDGVGTVWGFRATVSGGKAAAIRVVPSGDGDPQAARPARLIVLAATGAATIDLPDAIATRAPRGQAYTAQLPTPLDGCVSIVLADVYRGRGRGAATAIAELAVIADVEQTPEGAGPILTAQVAAGGLAGESAARMLVAQGAPAVVAIRAALVGATGDARRRLWLALIQIRDPGVAGPLAEALTAGEVPEDRAGAAAATLAAIGGDGQRVLVELIGGRAPSAVQQAAVDALAAVDLPALAARAGTATPRPAGWRAVATLPMATLIGLARAAPTTRPPRTCGARSAGGGRRRAADRAAAIAELLAALANAGKSYALRYRLLGALAPIADGAALATVAAAIARLPDAPAGHALARVAARGLAANPAAADALVALVAARDPGTRLEAVRGLTAAASDPRGDDAIAAVLAGDDWPALRQAAAAGLGQRCARPAPAAALIAAVAADAHVPVRVEAVAALGQCPSRAVDARLLAWVDDGAQPVPVRDRALAAYGERPGAEVAVLARFAAWRGQAFSDDVALRLAIRAATVLGARGAAMAGPELLAAARDTAFPELAAAAVRALGALGPACPAEAAAVLRGLVGADDQMQALAARAAITQSRPASPARP